MRTAWQAPDVVTASAVSARDEIGRAIADRIKQFQSTGDLKEVAEDVLPEIAKFLESPEERRLRRVRAGVITASAGLGEAVLLLIAGLLAVKQDVALLGGFGLIAFLIGVGLIMNGLLFTLPRKHALDDSRKVKSGNALTELPDVADNRPAELRPGDPIAVAPSVTEHTTHQLPDRAPSATDSH
ncbi:MAG TPA: hypothetical protein VJH03_11605 [Blastocatellia bacterium]|nr:hypothetical protein [Blastocatellia bacterium]